MYLRAPEISFLEAGLHGYLHDKGKPGDTTACPYSTKKKKKSWKETVTDEKLHFQQMEQLDVISSFHSFFIDMSVF